MEAPPRVDAIPRSQLITGIAVGLVAASIGPLYTVYARYGIVRGLSSSDITFIRFGVFWATR